MSRSKTNSGESGRRKTLAGLLTQAEGQLQSGEIKFGVADYLRLLQVYQEIADEGPQEISVTWVEPSAA